MSPRHRPQPTDPIKVVIEGVFKGLWWLVQLPFRDKQQAAERERLKAEFQRHWQTIEQWQAEGRLKDAVMQADILLDKALQASGVNGKTLGERLKSAQSRLSKMVLDMAWDAHKVRNRLAHELHYRLTEAEAQRALNNFKKVLRELGVL